MKRRNLFLVIIIMILCFFSAYYFVTYREGLGNNNTVEEPPKTVKPGEQVTEPSKGEDPIKMQVSSLSLEEKIGQLVIAGIDGYNFDDNTRQLIEKYKVGGFIILGQNVKTTNQLLNLVNSLKSANSKNKVPLFLSIDQEGGRIDRLPGEFKKYPTNETIGGINNSSFSFKLGNMLGEEIKAFGFNMDFAPVLDINSNSRNPVIGNRSFGSKSGVVSRLGVETMKGIQSAGIIPSVKHFPGHGDTDVDSHIGLPVVNKSLKELRDLELIPFAEAINNKADVVMIAHILLPKIDANNPSSFSKGIITDILRKEMGFKGLVITDDMTMGAVVKNYDIGEAAVKSINAGSDVILVCHGNDNMLKVIDSLRKAVNNGKISKERLDESLYRILTLKQKYKLEDKKIDKVDVNGINKKIEALINTYIK